MIHEPRRAGSGQSTHPLSPSEKIAHGGNRTRDSVPLAPWPEERQPTELPPPPPKERYQGTQSSTTAHRDHWQCRYKLPSTGRRTTVTGTPPPPGQGPGFMDHHRLGVMSPEKSISDEEHFRKRRGATPGSRRPQRRDERQERQVVSPQHCWHPTGGTDIGSDRSATVRQWPRDGYRSDTSLGSQPALQPQLGPFLGWSIVSN